MKVQIVKWGSSLVVRLPSSIAKQMQMQEGDKLNVSLNSHNELVLSPKRPFNKAKFIQDLLALQQTIPETNSVIEAMRT